MAYLDHSKTIFLPGNIATLLGFETRTQYDPITGDQICTVYYCIPFANQTWQYAMNINE